MDLHRQLHSDQAACFPYTHLTTKSGKGETTGIIRRTGRKNVNGSGEPVRDGIQTNQLVIAESRTNHMELIPIHKDFRHQGT